LGPTSPEGTPESSPARFGVPEPVLGYLSRNRPVPPGTAESFLFRVHDFQSSLKGLSPFC
jgi:hypothetical protein